MGRGRRDQRKGRTHRGDLAGTATMKVAAVAVGLYVLAAVGGLGVSRLIESVFYLIESVFYLIEKGLLLVGLF